VAVSQQRALDRYDFTESAAAGAQVVALVLKQGLAPRIFLNVNVPSGKPKGVRATFQAKRNHVTVVDVRIDPRSQPYYWIEEGEDSWEPHDQSDYQAVKDGFVSVTPLQPDLTAYDEMAALKALLA
jgi:5'-nucleotidase